MDYQNHFAEQSECYLEYRPTYPESLFDFLKSVVKGHDAVWDCGTGNGQAAVPLSERFKKVIATDLNQAQLDVAPKRENIEYHCCPSEKTPIPSQSMDLITIAQALHWFSFADFYKEVKRVAKPKGLISAWCYGLGSNPEIDDIIHRLYNEILWWPPERRYIDEGYRTIPFPFEKITTPVFAIEKELNYSQLLGYLNTWSAVKEYQQRHQQNPLELIDADLKAAWGDPQAQKLIRWPLHVLLGLVHPL